MTDGPDDLARQQAAHEAAHGARAPGRQEAPEVLPPTGTALVLAVSENPGIVLLDSARFDSFYDAIRDEVAKLTPDLTTAKGREAIKSMAFKVTKTKTAIDAAGKALKEEAQKTVQTVDAARRTIREKLEALAVEVRAPLTEWEVREAVRIEKVEGIINGLRADAVVSAAENAADVQERLTRVAASELSPEVLGDRLEEAQALHDTAVTALQAALERIRQEEADRAELEALRAAAAAAEAAKAAKVAAYEAAKAAQREKAEREAAEAAEALAAAERMANAEKEAARRAQEEAAAEAAAAMKAQQAAHEAALEAERKRADEAAAALKAQERQAQAARDAAAAEAETKRRADEARAADVEHRGRIMGAAKQAIMGHGVGEQTAKAIVLAIAAGEVPAVSIRF